MVPLMRSLFKFLPIFKTIFKFLWMKFSVSKSSKYLRPLWMVSKIIPNIWNFENSWYKNNCYWKIRMRRWRLLHKYSLILLSWKAKWLEINFLISEAWAERDLLHSTSLFLTLDRTRLYLLLPRQRNQKINCAQRTFYDSRLLLYDYDYQSRMKFD